MILEAMTTRILHVDDDLELRTLLCDYLGRQGIEVSTLHDAGTLQQRLERERPDVVVLDVLMPGVDGLTALGRLRTSGDDIPVILLTGRSDDVDRIIGLEMGADDYISKPFNPRELVARVEAILRRRRAVPSPSAPDSSLPTTPSRASTASSSPTPPPPSSAPSQAPAPSPATSNPQQA